MTVDNWSPPNIENYIIISWTQEGTIVNAGQNITAIITLYVNANVNGFSAFTSEIIITGTG